MTEDEIAKEMDVRYELYRESGADVGRPTEEKITFDAIATIGCIIGAALILIGWCLWK